MIQMKQPADQPKKLIRLNKYLAQLGIASRRKIDQLIERNQVWVNDKRVDLGMKIDPARDSVRIGKKQIDLKYAAVTHEYWLANKPVRSEERRVGKECRSRGSPY